MIFSILSALVVTPLDNASAQDIGSDTYLIGVSLGSARSEIVKDGTPPYTELSQGYRIDLGKFYSPLLPDLKLEFLTQLTEDFGITWGISTGEIARKYNIKPSVAVGFIHRIEVLNNLSLSTQVNVILGGRLTEYPCKGNYGEIGGVQSVNCRLAATALPPKRTLRYLFNQEALRESSISVRIEYVF